MFHNSLQQKILFFAILFALMGSPVVSFSEIIDAQIKGLDDGVKTSKQQDYKEAVLFAKREAIERAGIKIKSITTVKDFVLNSDYIESKAEAVLLPGYTIVDIGYTEDGTYQIVLIGRISVVNPPAAGLAKEDIPGEHRREDKNFMGSFEKGELSLAGWMNMRKIIGDNTGKGGYQKIYLDQKDGADGTSISIAMEYKIGKKTSINQPNIAILKNRLRRDISKFSGIKFFIKSTEKVIVIFGLEDLEKRGKKEERWLRNIYVTPVWEQKHISFDSLTLNRRMAQRFETNRVLELNRTEGIYWVVHEHHVKPAAKGKIWLDEISFYK